MAKSTETFATDKLTQSGVRAFQESVTKSMAAFGDLNDHSRRNLEAVSASVSVAAKGAENLSGMALAFAKKTAETNLAAVRTVTSAKDINQVVELQTAAAKDAMEAYVSEMTRWSEALTSTMRETIRPINERLLAVADQFQGPR